MRRLTRSLLLSAAILAAVCLAAGCSSTAKSAIASIAPSRSATTSSASAPDSSPSDASPTPSVTSPTTSPTTAPPSPSTTTVTATATATAKPTVTITQTASPSATVSGSPAASTGTGTSLLWLWILLGALVLVGLILLIMRASGRRSAAAAGWRSRVIDAYAKGSALYDAMSVAETPGALAANDAAARWYDIQRRADDLTQTLYRLRETAPNEDERGRIGDVLASLQAARSAMDAERAPGGAGPMHAETVRRRLLDFEASLRALRASDQPGP